MHKLRCRGVQTLPAGRYLIKGLFIRTGVLETFFLGAHPQYQWSLTLCLGSYCSAAYSMLVQPTTS